MAGNVPFAVTPDDRFENGAPVRGGGGVAGTQEAPFHVAALIDHEKRVVAGGLGVPVVRASLLPAENRAELPSTSKTDVFGAVSYTHLTLPTKRIV